MAFTTFMLRIMPPPIIIMFLLTTSMHSTAVCGMQHQPQSSKARLIQQASRVRQKLNLGLTPNTPALLGSTRSTCSTPSRKELYFPSSYQQHYGSRGFCNWLIPNHVMIGQYPGQTPESHRPGKEEVVSHIDKVVNRARIRLFLSLQSEVPDQEDDRAWTDAGGKVRLPVGGGREDFPQYFTHYAPLVRNTLDCSGADDSMKSKQEISFAHSPILDLNTPNSSSLMSLLSTLLEFLEDEDSCCDEEHSKFRNAVYIHCWGGRGRAGLVGSCLLSLLFPELDADSCLEWVQSGYDSRDGSAFMPIGLRRSPQTVQQRNFVKDFVRSSND